MKRPIVTGFYHEPTYSIAYLVEDPSTGHAAIIDPVLDFDENAGRISTQSADRMVDVVRQRNLTVDWVLDTHPHADHLSAAAYLKTTLGAQMATGERVVAVQSLWQDIYNLPPFSLGHWDRLFADGDIFQIGSIQTRVMLSPGHTMASVTYIADDAAFIHDTLFQPHYGTARTDFPGGDAGALYDSIQHILALPDGMRLFTGHDYPPDGEAASWESSVAAQKSGNKHLVACPDRASFVAMRQARDKTLPLPTLMLHALQVNLRGGRLPEPENNGRSYLKIPLGAF